ncbi:MAG: bifunctional DNA-formamidopyrimidine glycosylase/DNA-(apurinic or apyrimidinic site) lyase [Azovibrio sp.]|uniref:bifunctional DNA-formamidopyrimidine glycosylase/DNA-(apurinic or apyrimidinic site) lyase n=1 Tax=Azovibrio sp. TaxID=1872673 RepID=UPI003C70A91C
MPELPEVEVSRLGLAPHLEGQTLSAFTARRANLRLPIPIELAERLRGERLATLSRRGKYLLFHFPGAGGWLILHLGMSGSLRLVPPGTPAGLHDHLDLEFPHTVMRLRDPRRFGLAVWQVGDDPEIHPLLAVLGLEPLSDAFTPDWLAARARGRQQPIKQLLMDARTLVGVGNIYAAESLFRAGISPLRPAGRISPARLGQLVAAVRETLLDAIASGGSSVRDYVQSDGGAGSFQLRCAVYARAGQPCPRCGGSIRQVRQAGRSTFYCPACQR